MRLLFRRLIPALRLLPLPLAVLLLLILLLLLQQLSVARRFLDLPAQTLQVALVRRLLDPDFVSRIRSPVSDCLADRLADPVSLARLIFAVPAEEVWVAVP